jgi:hypothetical protein
MKASKNILEKYVAFAKNSLSLQYDSQGIQV